jgi:hypothetical protein
MLRQCAYSLAAVILLLTACFKTAHAFLPHHSGNQLLHSKKAWSGWQHSTITMRAGTANSNRYVGNSYCTAFQCTKNDSLSVLANNMLSRSLNTGRQSNVQFPLRHFTHVRSEQRFSGHTADYSISMPAVPTGAYKVKFQVLFPAGSCTPCDMQIKAAGGFSFVTAAHNKQYASVMTCVPGVLCSGMLFANVCHARYRELLVRFVEVGSVDSVIGAEECDSNTEYDTESDADYDSDCDDSTSSYEYQPGSTYNTQQTEYGQLYSTGYDQPQYDDSDNDDDSDEQDTDDAEYCSDSDSSEDCASSWIDEHTIHCVFERLKMTS